MKSKLLFILALILFQFSVNGQNNNVLQVITLDDLHSQAQPKDSKIKPEKYKLSSRDGFQLDCSAYDFSLIKKLNKGKDPDAIFIVCKGGSYMVELNMTGITTIDKSTMQSLDKKDKIFPGFIKGDTPIMTIGTLEIENHKAQMMSFWVGMLELE